MNTKTGKNSIARANEIVRPILLMTFGIVLALALIVSQPARADDNIPPTYPPTFKCQRGTICSV